MATATPTQPAPVLHNVPSSVRDAAERLLSVSSVPGKTAFVARALTALAKMTEELDERTLANIAGAPSDYLALVRALQQPEVAAIFQEDDPLLPARIRGLEARQQILEAEGGTMAVSEVAAMLGITRQAVEKRRKAGKLIALSLGKRGYAYPRWQFDTDGQVLRGLEETLGDVSERDGWTQAIFMLRPNTRLEYHRPLDELRQGNLSEVRRAARSYLEHGAA
jgi:hypothetical protein